MGLLDHARRRPYFALFATFTFLLAIGRAGWWWCGGWKARG